MSSADDHWTDLGIDAKYLGKIVIDIIYLIILPKSTVLVLINLSNER